MLLSSGRLWRYTWPLSPEGTHSVKRSCDALCPGVSVSAHYLASARIITCFVQVWIVEHGIRVTHFYIHRSSSTNISPSGKSEPLLRRVVTRPKPRTWWDDGDVRWLDLWFGHQTLRSYKFYMLYLILVSNTEYTEIAVVLNLAFK